MRLRQAHALITAATALEAAGIGIEMGPFDVGKYSAPDITTDHMTGSVEYNDPDNPDRDTRTYNIDILPDPDGHWIIVRVKFGYLDPPLLLDATYPVGAPQDGESHPFDDNIGVAVARLVVDAIRDYEKPFEAAYAQRAGQPPKERP